MKKKFTLWDGIVAVFLLAVILWTGHHLLKNYSNAYNEFLDSCDYRKIEKAMQEGGVEEIFCYLSYKLPNGKYETERTEPNLENLGEVAYIKSGWKHDPQVDTQSKIYLEDMYIKFSVQIQYQKKTYFFDFSSQDGITFTTGETTRPYYVQVPSLTAYLDEILEN